MTGGKARLGASRPLPPDDPKQRKPDITLARERLGWEPTVQLAEGLQRTIDWMKSVDLSDFRAPTPNY
jgi:UDP-glucuronate decarboxylase